jgi:hypothetical protein
MTVFPVAVSGVVVIVMALDDPPDPKRQPDRQRHDDRQKESDQGGQ